MSIQHDTLIEHLKTQIKELQEELARYKSGKVIEFSDELVVSIEALRRVSKEREALKEELAQAKEHWQSLKNILHDTQNELARYKKAVGMLMRDKRFELLNQYTIDAVYEATGGVDNG